MSKPASPSTPWLKAKDFESNRFEVAITNNTTKTQFNDSTQIEVTEFAEKGLTLKLPNTCCAFGHFLELEINRQHLLPPSAETTATSIIVTGKVTDVQPFDKKSNIIQLQFYQFDEHTWREVLKHLAERQNRADEAMKRIQE